MIPVNVLINNQTVLDELVSCVIGHSEDDFCLTVDLELETQAFWEECDPAVDHDELRIKVVVGDEVTYQFLIEERDTEVRQSGVGFSVWGRSKQAFLSAPFSLTVTDTEETEHTWQTENRTATQIIAEVVSTYCPYSVTVDWNASGYTVYAGSLTFSNQDPISIISSLADVIGAQLIADIDGSLRIEPYSVTESNATATYTDLDDIVQVNETVQSAPGYNAVIIYGYEGPAESASSKTAILSATRDGTGSIYPGREVLYNVYYYHSDGDKPTAYSEDVAVRRNSARTHGISDEPVQLIWGKGSTTYPDTNGVREVTGPESVPFDIVSEDYTTNRAVFSFNAPSRTGTFYIMFYFEDQSAYTVASYVVVEEPETIVPEDPDDDTPDSGDVADETNVYCAGMSLAAASDLNPSTIVAGDTVYFYLYGELDPYRIYTSNNSQGYTTSATQGSGVDVSETVTFTNGSASTSYPIRGDFQISWHGTTPGSVTWQKGTKALQCSALIGDSGRYYSLADITYETERATISYQVPNYWDVTTFGMWMTFLECSGVAAASVTVTPVESAATTRDITLTVKDHYTGSVVVGANVRIDGSTTGWGHTSAMSTDSNGQLALTGIAIGTHTFYATANGYLATDQDDIANGTFTVT